MASHSIPLKIHHNIAVIQPCNQKLAFHHVLTLKSGIQLSCSIHARWHVHLGPNFIIILISGEGQPRIIKFLIV
jgi:hypothetical protein